MNVGHRAGAGMERGEPIAGTKRGKAALPKELGLIFSAAGIPILQGYGLSETTGGSCVNHKTRNKYWTVGEPIGVELKIAADGEILFRGPTVMKGYFNIHSKKCSLSSSGAAL